MEVVPSVVFWQPRTKPENTTDSQIYNLLIDIHDEGKATKLITSSQILWRFYTKMFYDHV